MNQLWDKIGDWLLLAVLLITSVAVMLTSNDSVSRGLRARALETTAVVEEWFAGLGRYVRALEENEMLRDQNLTLSNDVARMRDAMHENERLRGLLSLADSLEGEMLAAEVVSKDITNERNYFVINVGREDGVSEAMAVIDTRGVVGKTVLVTKRHSKVMTYLNTDFRLPAVVLPAGADGIIQWDGVRFDRLQLKLVSRSTPVTAGDEVVTSGYSNIFREGYPVGTVDSVYTPPGLTTLTIHVQPAAPLGDVSHVFVLKKSRDPDRPKLDS